METRLQNWGGELGLGSWDWARWVEAFSGRWTVKDADTKGLREGHGQDRQAIWAAGWVERAEAGEFRVDI